MTREQEVFAEALAVERWQGEGAPHYIAEQLGAVALRGDAAGVARWQAIAAAYQALRDGARQ